MKKGLCIFLIFYTFQLQSQSATASFFKLSSPEKWWVIFHPFQAKKALNITTFTFRKTDSLKAVKILGNDLNGGQLDAFKHSFWMANLAQSIGVKAALKLGKAHEKGNYRFYKKNKLEDGFLPDKASSDMDLFNNEVGVKILKENPELHTADLIDKVILSILNGEMKIIKKNKEGQFLDCSGNKILKVDLIGRWENKKCLVNSNQIPSSSI